MNSLAPPPRDVWTFGTKTVNRVGFGAMRLTGRIPFGEGSIEDYGNAISVLQKAADLGVEHFDTATYYRSALHSANQLIKSAP
jgi:aryl-alcohol dehydrogenase-like predicted oxidoreductase